MYIGAHSDLEVPPQSFTLISEKVNVVQRHINGEKNLKENLKKKKE